MPALRRHRSVSGSAAVLVAVLAVACGIALAAGGSPARRGPVATVLDYFAALRAGDAAAALGLGAVPPGPRRLLAPDVLAGQQRTAPIEDVTARLLAHRGDRARVRVRYRLAFVRSTVTQAAVVGLHEADGIWRLERAAVRTRLRVRPAAERAEILGAAVPARPVLVFPGAAPVGFDAAALVLSPSAGSIGLDAGRVVRLRPVPSALERADAAAAVARRVTTCLTHVPADPRCPLPTTGAVPGTVRGGVLGTPPVQVRLTPSTAGVLRVSALVLARVHYRRVTFDGREVPAAGRRTLRIAAMTYASTPNRLVWTS